MEQQNQGGKKSAWWIILIIIILIIVVYFLLPKTETIEPEQTSVLIGDDIEITKVISEKQNLQTAGIGIPFNEVNDDYIFINVAVDFNQDSQFVQYQTSAGTQAEWIVMNMLVKVDPVENSSYSFLLTDEETLNKSNLPVVVTLSKERLTNWIGDALDNNEFKEATVAKIETEELDPYWDITEPENYGLGVAYAAEITHSASHQDMPDINQGRNECAPVATANSLIWMAKKYKFEKKMPDSQAALITELKNDLRWSAASGVSPSNYKAGKDAFMRRHQISVVTKKLGGNYEENLFEQIYQELRKGCDVEAGIQFKNNRGENTGAHMVTVSGTYRYSSVAQTESNLSVHDPLSRRRFPSEMYRINSGDNNRLNNYRYGRNAFVKEAWSECFVPPTVKEETPPPTTPPADPPAEPETPPTEPEPSGEGYGEAQPPVVEGTDHYFEHKIGDSPCPQTIGSVSLTGEGSWSISSSLPPWLQVSQSSGTVPGSINLQFNCVLAEYVTQEVAGSLTLELTDVDSNITTQSVSVGGYIEE